MGIVQEINDLLQGFLCLILAGHILKGDTGLLFHIHFRLTAAEAHHSLSAHPLGEHREQRKEQTEHNQGRQNGNDHGIIFHDGHVHFYTHRLKLICKRKNISASKTGVASLLLGRILLCHLLGHINDTVVPQLHLRKISCCHLRTEFGIAGLGILAACDHMDRGINEKNHTGSDQ